MIEESLYERALATPSPAVALRAAVEGLSAQGHPKADVYTSLEQLLHRLRSQGGRGGHEEVVLDIMDALTGWCHPNARLLPEDSAAEPER
jgi:hypothetical protein